MKLSLALVASILCLGLVVSCGNDVDDDDVAPVNTPAAAGGGSINTDAMDRSVGTTGDTTVGTGNMVQERQELEQELTEWHAKLEDLRARSETTIAGATGEIQTRIKDLEKTLLSADEQLDSAANVAQDRWQGIRASISQSLSTVAREFDRLEDRLSSGGVQGATGVNPQMNMEGNTGMTNRDAQENPPVRPQNQQQGSQQQGSQSQPQNQDR